MLLRQFPSGLDLAEVSSAFLKKCDQEQGVGDNPMIILNNSIKSALNSFFFQSQLT